MRLDVEMMRPSAPGLVVVGIIEEGPLPGRGDAERGGVDVSLVREWDLRWGSTWCVVFPFVNWEVDRESDGCGIARVI